MGGWDRSGVPSKRLRQLGIFPLGYCVSKTDVTISLACLKLSIEASNAMKKEFHSKIVQCYSLAGRTTDFDLAENKPGVFLVGRAATKKDYS